MPQLQKTRYLTFMHLANIYFKPASPGLKKLGSLGPGNSDCTFCKPKASFIDKTYNIKPDDPVLPESSPKNRIME
jgi:hypothetical protein